MNTDEIKMEVNIAGERFTLSVPFSRQEAVRNTEAEVEMLYRKFSETFPKKSPKEIISMVAYRFASSYFDILESSQNNAAEAADLLDFAKRLTECDSLSDLSDTDTEEFPLY